MRAAIIGVLAGFGVRAAPVPPLVLKKVDLYASIKVDFCPSVQAKTVKKAKPFLQSLFWAPKK